MVTLAGVTAPDACDWDFEMDCVLRAFHRISVYLTPVTEELWICLPVLCEFPLRAPSIKPKVSFPKTLPSGTFRSLVEKQIGQWLAYPFAVTITKDRGKVTRWKPAWFWKIWSWFLPDSLSPCKHLVSLLVRRPLWRERHAHDAHEWCLLRDREEDHSRWSLDQSPVSTKPGKTPPCFPHHLPVAVLTDLQEYVY